MHDVTITSSSLLHKSNIGQTSGYVSQDDHGLADEK